MCGIAGIVGAVDAGGEDRLAVALDLMAHRGPDGSGIHRSANALLGMRRLAIIDLAAGDQPIYNEDRRLVVVCNGEIYNYKEEMARLAGLGHRFQSGSDVNVVPHSYEDEGIDSVGRWRGMFAAALWDERQARLVLWRDRVGKKPLYYSQAGSQLVFASELPALVALLGSEPPIDPTAVAAYLRFGYVPHPLTIYRGVFAVPPGSVLTFERGRLSVRRYWRRGDKPSEAPFASLAAAVDAIDSAILEATRIRLRADVPVGLFLSGGIDSGLVASAAVRAGGSGLLAFTVGVDDPQLDESAEAANTARHLGLSVERIPLSLAPRDLVEQVATMFGQPFADSSAVASLAVSKAARRLRTVVLNGDGGDEVFAGYRRYQVARWATIGRLAGQIARPLVAAMGRSRRRSKVGFVRRGLRGFRAPAEDRFGLWTTDLFDPGTLRSCFPRLPGLPTPWPGGGFPPQYDGLRAMLTADYEWLLPDDLLVKMDIATMKCGLEGRSPLLDVNLAEMVWALPDRWILGRGTTKPLLRTLASRYLPASVAMAPKRGFEVPVAAWLAGDLRDLVRDALLSPNAGIREWAEPSQIRALVEGRQGTAGNQPQMIWALLMLELFLRARADRGWPCGG